MPTNSKEGDLAAGLIPEDWRLLYGNPLASPADLDGFRMEGQGACTFPQGRLRLESTLPPSEGQKANLVLWCPEEFPADAAVCWSFLPVREPGLAILFASARGHGNKDVFDPSLTPRTGEYEQYHHGEMDAFHVSYFRRMWPEERAFHTCNLRKSYGFHLVAQGADPLPGTADAADPYRLMLLKRGSRIVLAINGLKVLEWEDDGATFGPLLGGGKIGFRQMSPLIAEYGELAVYAP